MQEKITRESMVFYESFYEATKDLPPEDFKKCICGLINYGLYGIAPETTGIEKTIYVLSKPQIDKNNQRWANSKTRHSKKGTGGEQGFDTSDTSDGEEEKRDDKTTAAAQEVGEEADEDLTLAGMPAEVVMCESETVRVPEVKAEPVVVRGTTENTVLYEGPHKNVRLLFSEKLRIMTEIGILKYVDCVRYLSEYIKSNPDYVCDDALSDILGWVREKVDGVSLSG